MANEVNGVKNELLEVTSKDYYFDSYSHFGIHEEMLKDAVRTQTYRKSIIQNKHLFKGKVVLDVGCGTGILSMFAAQAGAKKVIGVDCASIAVQAREIVRVNGLDDTVEIIQGKIEELTLPVEKVDIIISEWMGYFLLYESMLDSVLYARDKWLAPGGLLFPDKANMYICAIEDSEYKDDKINCNYFRIQHYFDRFLFFISIVWDNVYGFDMSCIKEMALVEPLVDVVPKDHVISESSLLFSIDINTVTKEELDFVREFEIKFTTKDFCHALVSYFSVVFSPTHNKIGFSTGPKDKYTHWKQTVFYLDKELAVNPGDSIKGKISVNRNERNPRDLDISIESSFDGSEGLVTQSRLYRLR